MAFTYDPATDRGKVRLLIYDFTEADEVFSDASIDSFLELNSDSVWLAAADGCRSLAAGAAPKAYYVKISTALEVDKKQISKMFASLARDYQGRAGGSAEMLGEYVDSFAFGMTPTGIDTTEYVGDE